MTSKMTFKITSNATSGLLPTSLLYIKIQGYMEVKFIDKYPPDLNKSH